MSEVRSPYFRETQEMTAVAIAAIVPTKPKTKAKRDVLCCPSKALRGCLAAFAALCASLRITWKGVFRHNEAG